MANDALAQAIAEYNAAWQAFDPGRNAPNFAAWQHFAVARRKLRAMCPHDRFGKKGYGDAVCILCGTLLEREQDEGGEGGDRCPTQS